MAEPVIDAQTTGRVFDFDGRKWIILLPRDRNPLDWEDVIRLLEVDGQYHAPTAVGREMNDAIRQLHDAAREQEVVVQVIQATYPTYCVSVF